MKKYKHKITGTIAEENRFMCYTIKHERLAESMIDRKIVENSNDCEEVKEEPNYLITAFREVGNPFGDEKLAKIGSDGKYADWFTCEQMLYNHPCVEDGSFEIYSVKNSKGEEFTIGEKVKTVKDVFTISKFEICGDGIMVRFKETLEHDGLELISKVKTPIYTTTDGVDIFEGDKITLILIDKNNFARVNNGVYIKNFIKEEIEICNRYLTFTSEENRDKYIKENTKKPIFVSADNVEFYDNDTDYSLFSVLPKANWQENRYRLNDIVKWPKKEWLHFHTKEARQEYIDTNKPRFSLADVEIAYKKLMYHDFPDSKSIISELKKLGK